MLIYVFLNPFPFIFIFIFQLFVLVAYFEPSQHNFPMLSEDENVGVTKIKERKVILLQNESQSMKSSALLISLREDFTLIFSSKVEKVASPLHNPYVMNHSLILLCAFPTFLFRIS